MDAADEPTTWRCASATLGPGQTAKFRLRRDGKDAAGRAGAEGEASGYVDCFIVNHGGRYHAYVNRCPHAGTSLDLWPNEFWTEDGRHLICATHGAIFAPDTGVCVEGPCPGARLERLTVESDGAVVVVSCPA